MIEETAETPRIIAIEFELLTCLMIGVASPFLSCDRGAKPCFNLLFFHVHPSLDEAKTEFEREVKNSIIKKKQASFYHGGYQNERQQVGKVSAAKKEGQRKTYG
jgi:hypothetical protein